MYIVSCESRYTGFAVSIRIVVTKYRCIAMHRWIVTPLGWTLTETILFIASLPAHTINHSQLELWLTENNLNVYVRSVHGFLTTKTHNRLFRMYTNAFKLKYLTANLMQCDLGSVMIRSATSYHSDTSPLHPLMPQNIDKSKSHADLAAELIIKKSNT